MAGLIALCIPQTGWAADDLLMMTTHPLAWLCVAIFAIAYIAVMAEEKIHLRKSKPVILAAGIIWALIAWLAQGKGVSHDNLSGAVMHDLEEYAAMFLFLLVAMTYINAMEERQVFSSLRSWLIQKGYNFRQLFWVTGILAFLISPIADNLTTALLMGAVIMSVGQRDVRFISLAMINVVVAANAGGAFSPFGDITTLMVWQAGKVKFAEFFVLFIPSFVNFLVPAMVMSAFVSKGQPLPVQDEVSMRQGGLGICLLFLLTIAIAVSFENFLGLPPFMGMMTGLALLMFYTYFLNLQGLTSSKQFPSACTTMKIWTCFNVSHGQNGIPYCFSLVLFSRWVGCGISATWKWCLKLCTMASDIAGPISSLGSSQPLLITFR